MKNYVVIKFNDGKYKIWADYGDIAWGSPAYEVLDYFPNHKSAKEFVKQQKSETIKNEIIKKSGVSQTWADQHLEVIFD